MLISDYRERRERSHEKIRILLNFLKEETYSDFKTLMLLFGYKNHKPLYLLLGKAIDMGLIQKHQIDTRTVKISLWGITNDGLSFVVKPHEDGFPARFEPSKVTGWMLDQHLDNQLARLILEKKGAYGWLHGDRPTFRSHYRTTHRPDGVITLPNGTIIAIETERRLKTKARYQAIIANHLLARTQKHWMYVFYIVPDPQKKLAIELLFNSIKHVIVNHQHIRLEAKHRNVFRVYTVEELKGFELNFG
ncbi:MobC family replication-relaxation protein [Pectobacterium brasiliense]|uniref:Molybdopterin-guanine dinucleotide biosynthesis protein MobC n=1 Tax=Pectobacterium brasiliense TaxID=180957 RepID=A0A3S5K241_9GAMM|nr:MULTISPECIES: MobC family replication-relaxation protein [Pectobacterium]GKW28076.1 molybdopterin-guanine dinucleotide biosynthesis protein MobC [Pectobacterium carotovorum subsp. carotovorum]MBN3046805.1 molybdopterin-guanine dinucleotide biosynthesis protein MobC [Pectobacterium brasiliense]MBN3075061.1 molybdopterin-guanine dinucleotide biosynthesis protein MobC [Pectobacterium brasiliense]MBN3083813.1 molybdopterin-guanine dinucleotide biosynthesis protein MobC [Pectobacterium brasiliens